MLFGYPDVITKPYMTSSIFENCKETLLTLMRNVGTVCKIWGVDDITRKLLKFQIIKESLCVLSNFEAS